MKRPRSTIRCRDALAALAFVTGALPARADANAPDAGESARPNVVLHGNGSVVAPAPQVRSTSKQVPGFESARLVATPPSPDPASVARFRAALEALSTGRRADPVRVLWLGDSHTAADFWPDAVRSALQERYGNGGPGFVSLGRRDYRHAGVKVLRDGRWKTVPHKPSLWVSQDDGVFGLTGIRMVAEHEASKASVEIRPAVAVAHRWDLSYRLPTRASRFRLTPSGGTPRVVDAQSCDVGKVQHLTWESAESGGLVIDRAAGNPDVFGVVVERAKPGVVLDTLGINGARLATPLAWNEASWVEEARLRKPSLVVFAYGTNEVGDQVAPHRYAETLEKLVLRARKAAPDADCAVFGPTDRLDKDWQTEPRVKEIDAVERETAERLGCWYVSVYGLMAQGGGYRHFANMLPPLAARDRIHLTMKGYSEIGAAIARALLGDTSSAP
jgi:lysophospholipase L1-like esterase